MDTLPTHIICELQIAHTKAVRRKSRLRVEAGGMSLPITRMTDEGFVVERRGTKRLRGLVDLFDGGRHLSQCLIVAAQENAAQIHYEFKRNTTASDGAPLDFERPADAPIALLGR